MKDYTFRDHFYSLLRKNEILTLCHNMDGPRGYYTKSNKSEKDKYHMISYVELKNKIN